MQLLINVYTFLKRCFIVVYFLTIFYFISPYYLFIFLLRACLLKILQVVNIFAFKSRAKVEL